MKKYNWVFLCLFLYLVCIGAGITTRNSYTDIWAEVPAQPQDRIKYVFREDKDAYFTASPQSILDQAAVIVSATANSEGESKGKTFLTEMTVNKIYKNDGSFIGTTLVVCEPIRLNKITSQKDGKPLYTMEMLQGRGHRARTKITPGKNYILLLREFLPKGYRTEIPTYTMIESPYAKLSPDSITTAEQYAKPTWPIDYEQSKEYEILLQDKNQTNPFFDTKKKVLSLLQ